jgi:hypothetical protein
MTDLYNYSNSEFNSSQQAFAAEDKPPCCNLSQVVSSPEIQFYIPSAEKLSEAGHSFISYLIHFDVS